MAEKINENPVFNVSVIYKLEGKDLVVEVPLQDLQYDKETPTRGFPGWRDPLAGVFYCTKR